MILDIIVLIGYCLTFTIIYYFEPKRDACLSLSVKYHNEIWQQLSLEKQISLSKKHFKVIENFFKSEHTYDLFIMMVIHIVLTIAIIPLIFNPEIVFESVVKIILLFLIGAGIRWVEHDGMINILRGLKWCHIPSSNNENDTSDNFLISFYNKTKIKPCILQAVVLIVLIVIYLILVLL